MRRLFAVALAVAISFSGGVILAGPGDRETPEVPGENEHRHEVGPLGEVTITPNTQNVIAGEIYGKWKTDAELTRRLEGLDQLANVNHVEFRRSKDARNRVLRELVELRNRIEKHKPEALDRYERAMQTLYAVGEFVYDIGTRPQTYDFALTVLNGNPTLFIIDTDDSDCQTMTVMLARDAESDEDLLFLGGEYNVCTFEAFRRVEESSGQGNDED